MSSGGGIRTPDTRIMIQRVRCENTEENAHSQNCAAAGAAVGFEKTPIAPDLRAIIDAWPKLDDEVKFRIGELVREAQAPPRGGIFYE